MTFAFLLLHLVHVAVREDYVFFIFLPLFKDSFFFLLPLFEFVFFFVVGNAFHVNAYASFEMVEMNESVFRENEDDAVTSRNLHCDGEVVCCLGREEDIDFFLERRIIRIRIIINLDDMQLAESTRWYL